MNAPPPVAGPEAASTAAAPRPGWLSHTFESLSNRNFRMLWLGMVTSMAGAQMQFFVRGILAYDVTESAFLTSIVTMGWAPTMLVFSLLGGVIGEKFERRAIIQASQFFSAVQAGVLAILIFAGVLHWTHLLVISLIQGTFFAFQMPARQVIIPRLVGKEGVSNAMALNAMAMSSMNLVAPGIGGVLYGLIGAGWVHIVITALSLVAVGFTTMVPRVYPEGTGSGRSVLGDIRDGFSYIAATPIIRMLIIQGLLVALLSMPFRMMVQVFAEDVYGSDPFAVGMLAAAAGAGGLFGSLVIANLRAGNQRGAILIGSGFLSAAALLLATGLPIYAIGIACLFGLGIGETGRWALGQTLTMEYTDDRYRARVMSVYMMTFGLMPVAVLPYGQAIEAFGARDATMGMGLLLLAVCVALFVVQKKLWRLQ